MRPARGHALAPSLALQESAGGGCQEEICERGASGRGTKENADLLWVTRAIIDDPSDSLPPPNAKDLAVNEVILDAEAWSSGTNRLCAFSDGSCTRELELEMERASSSATLRARRQRATSVSVAVQRGRGVHRPCAGLGGCTR